MGRLWSTTALVLLLTGLVAYIYFVDAERPAPGVETREKVFAELNADDVEELQVRGAGGGEAATLRKQEGVWQLIEPVEAPADESEASSIASGLVSLEIDRVVDEAGSDLSQYGLDPARIEVAFKTAGQDALRRVRIGDKTPTGGNLYASVEGDPRVFLLPSYFDTTFDKDAFTLRDRRILTFDRSAADRLEVNDGTATTTLVKQGSAWRIEAPIAARADYAAVEGAIERLSSTRMQGIVSEDGAEERAHGFGRPSGTITVGSGSARATLTLGATDNALLFARDSSRPLVFTVAPAIRGDVIRTVADFRSKDLFDARSFTTDRVELRRGDQTVTLQKAEGDEGAVTWTNVAGETVETEKVSDLLTKLTGLRAQSFEERRHPSLGSPDLSVSLTFDDGKTESVAFGRSGESAVASREDEPGSATFDVSSLDDVLKALDEVQ